MAAEAVGPRDAAPGKRSHDIEEPHWADGKPPASQVEDVEARISAFAEGKSSSHGLSEQEQKRVIRKIDWRLLPMLGLMYSMSLIDRSNIGLALVAGMEEDLDLAILKLIISRIFEIPSNLILPKAGPANWLAFLGVSFGSIMIGMGFTKSWGTMALCRALLGAAEAGFMPGCAYLITCWYTRYEVGTRIAAFWILCVVSGGFAAILAYALSLLAGTHNLNGWNWIFIIEGAITTGICLLGWFIVPPFPSAAPPRLLSARQKAFIISRIDADRGDALEDAVTGSKILHHLRDWKLYFWAVNLMASTLPGYAYAYFLPVILRRGMGFSTAKSQLLSAPPYVLAALLMYASGWMSDRWRLRGPLLMVHQIMPAVGMLVTAFAEHNGARYFGAFLGIGFLHFGVPCTLTFQANNITSHSKRAVASATCVIGGGIGGIIAGVAFKSSESPKYTTGVFVTLALSLFSISLTGIMDFYFWRCNKLVKEGKRVNEGLQDWYYTY